VRLFSCLHALALAELEDQSSSDSQGFELELLDGKGLDDVTHLAIRMQPCKVELVFHWIQTLVVTGYNDGILKVPAPILTRALQELSDGMVHFNDALKLTNVPLPFPYTQAALLLMIMHLVISPVLICNWTNDAVVAGLFSFVHVFTLWTLHAITRELENPFGQDADDLDIQSMQQEMNAKLLLLVNRDAALHSPGLASRLADEPLKRGPLVHDNFVGIWCEISNRMVSAVCDGSAVDKKLIDVPACRASELVSEMSDIDRYEVAQGEIRWRA